ncbi:ABC transporter substrate-binding protein [Agromyces larvae]|uniref:ABC transporter substrate-binding protein n=1 Tax=Agromyces larvae TaxID=2929802 RepID=A0ABY4BVW5_9MICO|nr:ABC transporter substrate-binding protein [Agromyces larvae]UOE43355.1 ABC transporter substrate-binding protein [Agromyces larvae]
MTLRSKHPRARLVLAGVALVGAAAMLAGCAGPAQDEVPTADSQTDLARPPAEDDPNAVAGGTLRLSTSSDPVCLDGHQVSTAQLQLLGRIIYDNLVSLDADGNPSPWLAESWDISEDGRTYTFHLRDDVTFSDGTPFDAAAVVANFDHMAAPETKSPLAAAYIDPIASTRVIDDETLEVKLDYAYSPFLYVLAQGWLGLISPKQLAEHPEQTCLQPIGSGPYVVEKYTPGEGVTFAKRADYDWSADYLNHDGPAYLDRIEISFITEPAVRYSSLVSGEFDATDNIAPQNAAAIEADSSIEYHNISRIGNPQRITLNTSRPPFDDLKVRQALALGIDSEGIAEAVGFGEYEPRHAFLSPTTQYYDPAAEEAWEYDPDRAGELLDEAGWSTIDADGYRTKDGQRLTAEFPVTETATPGSLNDLIQSELKKLGVELKLIQLPSAEAQERRRNGDYDIGTGVWHTNTPDALYIVYASGEITSPERIGQNTSRLTDAELDGILLDARQTTDTEELAELYGKAQARLAELVPAIPLYDFYTPWAVHDNLHGVLADSSHGVPLFTIAWLEP